MKAMLLTKLKGGLWALLVAAAVGVSAAGWAYRSAAAEPAPAADPSYVGRAVERRRSGPRRRTIWKRCGARSRRSRSASSALENQTRPPMGGIGFGTSGLRNLNVVPGADGAILSGAVPPPALGPGSAAGPAAMGPPAGSPAACAGRRGRGDAEAAATP